VPDKLESIAKDPCPWPEPCPLQAWDVRPVTIEIADFVPIPVLAPRDTPKMALRFLANIAPLPKSAAV
jgi:hypothetical protein